MRGFVEMGSVKHDQWLLELTYFNPDKVRSKEVLIEAELEDLFLYRGLDKEGIFCYNIDKKKGRLVKWEAQ